MLQIYNDKLNGENVSGLLYTELAALESVLQQGICSVDEQIEKEDFIYQGVLATRRTTLRHKARELRLSSRGSQQEHHPDPKVLAQDELYVKQIVKCEIMGDKDTEWIDKTDSEDFIYQGVLAKRRTTLRHKARELRLSSGSSQQEHGTDLRVLKSLIEGFTVEKERVRLWNERMVGKELKGMSFHELMMFKIEIQTGLGKVKDEMLRSTQQAREAGQI